MSVVIAIHDPITGRGVMGCDEQSQAGDLRLRSAGKVVQLGRAMLGSVGLTLAAAWWRRQAGPGPEQAPVEWAEERQEEFRRWAVLHGHGEAQGGVWSVDFHALLLTREGILVLGGDGSVEQAQPSQRSDRLVYSAAGSGQMVALGAVHGLLAWSADYRLDAWSEPAPDYGRLHNLARMAVLAACTHVVGCGGEPLTLVIGPGPDGATR